MYLYTGGGKHYIRQAYTSKDGWSFYKRDCGWDNESGTISQYSPCTGFSIEKLTTPGPVKGFEEFVMFGKLRQSFISADGTKQYFRNCSFDNRTRLTYDCDVYKLADIGHNPNGYGAYVYNDSYGRNIIQQFFVGSDGRTPYLRNCKATDINTVSCPLFL